MKDAGVLVAIAAVLVVAALYGMHREARRRMAAHGLLTLAWRWHTGMSYHGVPLTDRGWFRPGVRALTQTGHAPRWHYLPRWRHAARRSSATLAAAVLLWAWVARGALVLWVLAGVLVPAAVLGVCLSVRALRKRKHRRTWEWPLHRVLAPVVGVPLAHSPASWISVERDRSVVRLALPQGFPANDMDKARVKSITSQKLALEAPEVSWHLEGPAPFVMLTRSEPPPRQVSLSDVMDAVEEARAAELVIGLGKKRALVKVSLSSDSPHLGVSMGSGAGKSTYAAFIIMQWLHAGGIVLILDAKWHSHPWLIGLPNVAYARTTAELHAAMAWLSWELDRRNQVVLRSIDTRGVVHADVGARLLVVGEELNVAMERLKAYWMEIRGTADPKRSPALSGYADLSYAGRGVKMHGLSIGQMLTARSTGSSDSSVRESMGVLALSRYTQKTWNMLAPQHPMPLSPIEPGRIQLVTARSVREVQVPFIDLERNPEPAREYAMSGIVTPCPSGMPGRQVTGGVPAITATDDLPPDLHVVTPVTGIPSRGVTLREAVEADVLGPTLGAVRQYRHRYADRFPQPIGHRNLASLYDPAELAGFAQWITGRRDNVR